MSKICDCYYCDNSCYLITKVWECTKGNVMIVDESGLHIDSDEECSDFKEV